VSGHADASAAGGGAGARTDAEVIGASIDDPAAFWSLFQRHYDPIFAFIARRLGPDAADDLATDVFLTAFTLRARYDQRHAEARPWLFGIAANMVRRHRRAETRRLRAYARHARRAGVAHEDDGVERLDGLAAAPQLAKALASMTTGQRDVLLLIAWAELTPEEVARALHIPPGTVRSRLSRARARARLQLRKAMPDDDTDAPEHVREAVQWTTSS